MKKLLMAIALFGVAFVVANSYDVRVEGPIEKAGKSSIDVKKGDILRVIFSESSGTPYMWKLKQPVPKGVKVIAESVESMPAAASEVLEEGGIEIEEAVVTGGLQERIFEFRLEKVGKYILPFEYALRIVKNKKIKPEAVFSVTVNVKKK